MDRNGVQSKLFRNRETKHQTCVSLAHVILFYYYLLG